MSNHNRRIHKEYLEELACLNPLSERKTTDYTEERVCVSSSSTILLKGVIYSVPAKFIVETLKIHLYDDRLECFIGGCHVINLPRKRKNRRYELADRESRRPSRRMGESNLPKGKSIETFEFEVVPNLNKSQIMGFGQGEIWYKRRV